MGILNITPDSFSDGQAGYADVDGVVSRAESMVTQGARIIDVGGESTRPGSAPVTAEIEMARVLPVIRALAQRRLAAVISIDTYKPQVAQRAIAAGARIVNDIGTLRDPEMVRVVADAGVTVIIMHSRGPVKQMQQVPAYRDVVEDVRHDLEQAVHRAKSSGIDTRRIWLDPGLGFSKSFEHNLALLKGLGRLNHLGHPVVLGASRKRFLGTITGEVVPRNRDAATAATSALVAQRGHAQVFRVHNVAATAHALAVAQAIDA